MSEHTPLTEAGAKVAEAIAKWEDRGPTSLTVALLAEAVYAARDALAARTSTATADTACPTCVREGGPYRCCEHCLDDPEYHLGDNPPNSHEVPCSICVERNSNRRAATADTGLRERVEAAEAALRWIADEPSIENCAPDCMPRAACQRSDIGHMFCGFCLDCQEPRHHCGHTLDATPASTEDRADNEGTP